MPAMFGLVSHRSWEKSVFNLIVRHFEWDAEHGEISADRLFEHTDGLLAAQLKNGDVPDYAKLSGLPCCS